ncbi:MAG: trehalose-6-phosphate synthase [SAR202 cluster bacterium]|uniref:Alpha,alpha-trehalose-phosphate synthase [UDP-forming] n=1 Tax=hydrothermal vent metagenome TaxID=652676 RepID=A0A170Q9F2_9ZZZZ|nr:trehalose-6-phosphate synthase [Dehalococcoidia bacterium]MQF91065.1 trehalose-6-phosphate synthase [SAR202 cluster bacterium]MQG63576.1 trehalose-6-phosphate synthase [SAR202 cluster bacterium]
MADVNELTELCEAVFSQRPLILVSNRGPVEHQMSGDGRPEARRGSGSVVTAFNSLAQKFEFTWVASAMGEGDRVVSENGQGPHIKSPLPGHEINLRYVVTPRRVYHKYYNILCNPLLWFLQHYMWNPPYNPNVDAAVHDAWESGYIPVNQAFANAVISEAQALEQAPIVIGHDYHLYLMPEFVRKGVPEAVIQHFVHIPWPTPQYWHMIPDYIIRRICESLCTTDLLGFQTIGDVRCFLDTVEEFVPDVTVDRTSHTVARNGRTTSVKVYPISINVEEVQRIANTPRALDYENRLSADTGDVTIVRIDRAEPNKNIVRGFRAYELMLTRYPELKGKVKFLAFLVPSRTHIRQYQRYMDEIQQVIQQINNNHGTDDWQPIVPFIENNYTQAIAGMKLYDVLLVNTIIEGMNLVAKEGPVVNNRDGVLVLSHSSGVYQQLSDGAISVSPTDIEGTMEALHQAITMSAEDRKARAARMLSSVCREDINHWLYQQMNDISGIL